MINSGKRANFVRYAMTLLLFFNVFRAYSNIKTPQAILIALFLLIMMNDLIRSNFKDHDRLGYCLSLVISIIGSAIVKYFIAGIAANIYMLFCVVEILQMDGRRKQMLLTLHGVLYLTIVIVNTQGLNMTERLTEIGTNLLTYFSLISALFLSHEMRRKREETKKLNEELKASNIKLQEYSLKVEELAVTKERERVAQELHDSLGHSLMALGMHLEFAEKIFDTNSVKAKEAIKKAKNISKDSTASLRMAVSALKEERSIDDLRNAISELIENFKILQNIKIDFTMDSSLETINPDVKLCIYKTVRESITNGIKHGKASAFHVEINGGKVSIRLSISDNGMGSDTIIKSNGLTGIENRIHALGGSVEFSSGTDGGFLTEAEIPIYEEMN